VASEPSARPRLRRFCGSGWGPVLLATVQQGGALGERLVLYPCVIYVPSIPSSRARAVASVRFVAPSLPRRWVTCFFTVLSETYSSAVISWFGLPIETRRNTSISRSLSGSTSGDMLVAVAAGESRRQPPPPETHVPAEQQTTAVRSRHGHHFSLSALP
jgi:hypothetical protein